MSSIAFDLSFEPLTPERWTAFTTLFGSNGACGGCWCMAWRVRASEWNAMKGARNREAMRRRVRRGPPPGILALVADRAVGWCAVAPRSEYPRLETSRVLRPVDDVPVWSISCLFIQKEFRRRGLSARLLGAAVRFARDRGAQVVEGYPIIPKTSHTPDVFAWTGTVTAFQRAGFVEVHRWSPQRPIMRIDAARRP